MGIKKGIKKKKIDKKDSGLSKKDENLKNGIDKKNSDKKNSGLYKKAENLKKGINKKNSGLYKKEKIKK